MRKVEVELITVTPLFLGGSDPRNGPPELRPPSFRGAMRYWYRAAVGGVVGDDWKKVRQLEGKIFGITSDEEKEEKEGRGSAVSVRVSLKRQITSRDYVKERGKPPSGKDYLFWSMAETGSRERGNFQPARKFIEEGFPFSVVLSTQKFGSEADYTLRHAVYSLWLAVHLGGFGSRSRRMAGSLSPLRVQSIDGLTFGLTKSNPKEIAEELAANLRIIRQSLIRDLRDETNLSGVPSFDILNPAYCKIWVLGKAPNADVALNFVGRMMQEFRNQDKTSASRVFQWLRGQNIKPIERVQFGLPIVYRFMKKENNQSKLIANGTVIAGMKKGDQIEKIERRASPLWISALRSPDNQVIVTATFFNSQFLPRGADLMVDKRKDLPLINPPDVNSSENSPIMKWIKQKFPKAVEVDYA